MDGAEPNKRLSVTPQQKPKASKIESGHTQALKVKASYISSTTSATHILKSIKENPSWAQFGGHCEKCLQDDLDAVNKTIEQNVFHGQIIIDQLGLKKRMEAQAYDQACKDFATTVKGAVAALEKQIKKLNVQHAAGLAVDNA